MRLSRLILFALMLALVYGGHCHCPGAEPDWRRAVVRIPSHGITGTVVASQEGRSLVLSCAHGFVEGQDRTRVPVVVDVPVPEGEQLPRAAGSPRLLALDAQLDLSLIEVPAGPLAVVPVAPQGYQLGRNILSCGYDEMKWANGPQIYRATVTGDRWGILETREIPWHGRSGGPLLDADARVVIGVVQGYEVSPSAKSPGRYIDTQTIQAFLARATREGLPEQARPPQKLVPQRLGDAQPQPAPPPQDDWRQNPDGSRSRGGLTPIQDPRQQPRPQPQAQPQMWSPPPMCLPGRQ